MSDLINKEIAKKAINNYFIGLIKKSIYEVDVVDCNAELCNDIIDKIDVAYDVDNELRLLKNYISMMPKIYRKRNANWVIVQDLLMAGTSHAGRTSSIKKCIELGVDAYDYDLIVKGAVKE